MLKKIIILLVFPVMFLITGCESMKEGGAEYEKSFDIALNNTLGIERTDEAINLELAEIKSAHPDFNSNAFAIFDGDEELASQISDTNLDGVADLITLVKNFQPGESSSVAIRFNTAGYVEHNYKKRTQAEVSVKMDYELKGVKYTGGRFQNVDKVKLPENHEDHNAFLRYEGPGWESEKVGYRLYLDARTRTDIWGKKVDTLVLQDVGVNDLVAEDESYQSMMNWGMDIFKVGKSLGIGSITMPTEKGLEIVAETDSVICYIASNGVVRSEVLTKYFGWQTSTGKYNFTTSHVITAGSRLTEFNATINPSVDALATGLAKHENTEYFISENKETGWQYIALYGTQTLADDDLGIALIYQKADEIEVTEDDLSYIVKLKPADGKLQYYFAAAWVQEPNGIKTKDQFKEYLNTVILKLDSPVTVAVK